VTESNATQPTTLRLIVPDDETLGADSFFSEPATRFGKEGAIDTAPDTKLAPDQSHYERFGSFLGRGILKHQDIPIDKIKTELARVDDEVDSVIEAVRTKAAAGFQLKEVQVGVVISAQGSIGVATAGIQASLTLVYSQP
jgi:hypothetical protein